MEGSSDLLAGRFNVLRPQLEAKGCGLKSGILRLVSRYGLKEVAFALACRKKRGTPVGLRPVLYGFGDLGGIVGDLVDKRENLEGLQRVVGCGNQ